ncbi:MAG: AAA family ATPase [Chloroflexia bacterium]|nr:AAA family ATPase [Chloroflexia bacterium]
MNTPTSTEKTNPLEQAESKPLAHKVVTDDLAALLDTLPLRLSEPLRRDPGLSDLLEVVLDFGRRPEARFRNREVVLSDQEISLEDLQYVIFRTSTFTGDNRAGIERTLHRISAIRSRDGRIIGLTCRVGRAIFGTIAIIQDLVETGANILLLGKPGVGKTTMLREVARVLADDFRKRVVIVDTSNEIGGDGDIPHPAIGRARRMQVPSPDQQHAVMIEAVENHMPEVIVIDEIGTELEAAAARTIAERGVQLVATAHGNTLENLLLNPTLSDLIGGIQSVTLGDEEARRRGTQKTILERKAPPTFDIVVEIQDWDTVAVHQDVAEVVDTILRGFPAPAELRQRKADGQIERWIEQDYFGGGMEMRPRALRRQTENHRETRSRKGGAPRPQQAAPPAPKSRRSSALRVYSFGVNRKRLLRAVRSMEVPVQLVEDQEQADAVVTLQSYYRQAPRRLRDAEQSGLPIYVLKSNAESQMENFLRVLFNMPTGGEKSVNQALEETQEAIEQVLRGEMEEVELPPQNSYVRRLQHQLVNRYQLASESRGKEPYRRVRLFRADKE